MKKLNIDPRFNPITTITGSILLLLGIVGYVGSMFIDLKKDVNIWISVMLILSGSLLIVSKDAWINSIVYFFRKMSDKIWR